MRWFRFYSEAMHDPKLLRLSDESFRFWVNILCLASDGQPRGTLPNTEDIATVMRMKTTKVERLVGELVAGRLLDRDGANALKPHGWESRQLRGDDSAAIKRNQRDKHKKKTGQTSESPPDVHGQSTECPSLDSDDDYVIKRQRQRQTTDETNPSPPPSNGIVEMFTLNPDHAALIEAAKAAFGSQFADTVAEMGRDIEDTLSGRWDCYAAAIKSAKRSTKPIDNLHLYCLRTGEKFTRNGIPPEPVASNGQPVATRALPQQNVNPPAPKGPPVAPAETDTAIAALRSTHPEFRRKPGGPK